MDEWEGGVSRGGRRGGRLARRRSDEAVGVYVLDGINNMGVCVPWIWFICEPKADYTTDGTTEGDQFYTGVWLSS
jgi:hypothetical protein